jgi:cellulose biosynthesis protein BcsQ
MNLALIVGNKSSQIANSLIKHKTDLDIEVYDDILSFLDKSIKMTIFYDRVVISSNMVKSESDLTSLKGYIDTFSKELDVVFLCRKTEESFAKTVDGVFNNTNKVVACLIQAPTLQTIAELSSLRVPKLRSQYGLKTETNDWAAQELVYTPKTEEQKAEAQEETPSEPKVEETKPVQPTQPKKKFSLFGGKKKQKQAQPQGNQQAQTQPSSNQPNPNGNQPNPQMQGNPFGGQAGTNPQMQGNPFGNVNQPNPFTQVRQNNHQGNPFNQQARPNPQNQGNPFGNTNQPNHNGNPQAQANPFENSNQGNPFGNANQTNPFGASNPFETQAQTNHQISMVNQPNSQDDNFKPANNTPKTLEQAVNQGSPAQTESDELPKINAFDETEEDIEPSLEIPNDEAKQPEFKSAYALSEEDLNATDDIDLSEYDIDSNTSESVETPMQNQPTSRVDNTESEVKNSQVNNEPTSLADSTTPIYTFEDIAHEYSDFVPETEVEDDLGSFSISSDENQYREQESQPKVIIKEVYRGGKTSLNALENVYSGRAHKSIIVTGDRDTGVTTTSLILAKEFSAHVPVLYVDCDCDNHGLLNYIDTKILYNYDDSVLSATKRLRRPEYVHNCVCKYEDNFDILTSDFSVDVSEEDLVSTAEAVSGVIDDYGVVIFDCPIKHIQVLEDLILVGNTVICTESTNRGIMNMLCQMESSTLSAKFKKRIASRGVMLYTKQTKSVNLQKLVNYFKSIFTPEVAGTDWVSMDSTPFTGKPSPELLNRILEG